MKSATDVKVKLFIRNTINFLYCLITTNMYFIVSPDQKCLQEEDNRSEGKIIHKKYDY